MSDPPTPGTSTARPEFHGRPKAAEVRRTLQAFGLGSFLGLVLLRLPRSADPPRG